TTSWSAAPRRATASFTSTTSRASEWRSTGTTPSATRLDHAARLLRFLRDRYAALRGRGPHREVTAESTGRSAGGASAFGASVVSPSADPLELVLAAVLNTIPEPETRSRTVAETSTSLG